MNRNCLSYWFPRLVAAGVPVPRTELFWWRGNPLGLTKLLDGEEPAGWGDFLHVLRCAAYRISETGPWFLRTGQGSGKHLWKDTCHVTDLAIIGNHVARLVEWSHMVDFFGLAHDVWVVREVLPTKPLATLPRYGDFPLVKEVRAFVKDGVICCQHPYWPEDAILAGLDRTHDPNDRLHDARELARVAAEAVSDFGWRSIALQVAAVFASDGAWSVDILPTDNGWCVTDMAEADRSFHWPGCPHANAA